MKWPCTGTWHWPEQQGWIHCRCFAHESCSIIQETNCKQIQIWWMTHLKVARSSECCRLTPARCYRHLVHVATVCGCLPDSSSVLQKTSTAEGSHCKHAYQLHNTHNYWNIMSAQYHLLAKVHWQLTEHCEAGCAATVNAHNMQLQ